jgi:glycosyltransferase involved in cell wall biosynthesis
MPQSAPKVLLFTGRFEVRGTSAYTLRLAERLPALGFQPLVVTTDAHLVPEDRRRELTIREYPRLDVPLWGRLVQRSLLADLAKSPPDLVHAQSWRMLKSAAVVSRNLGRPLLLTVHDHVPGRQPESWSGLPLLRIIAVSRAVRADLVGRVRLPEEAIEVVNSGVELPPEEMETLPVLDPGHVPVVGTAGPLEVVKGVPFFLGAARRVLATGRDVEFLVAGAGPEESNLRHVARMLGIERHVTFVPNLREFTASIAAMDVFCLPSLRQGLGTVMLEAMALGKPVVATGVGGVASIVRDGETGLVVPPCDSARLAERILELLDDPLRARTLGETGRRVAREEFSVDHMAERTADVYRAVLAESRLSAVSA